MKNKHASKQLIKDQEVSTKSGAHFDHPCCICGDPVAPFGFGVDVLHGLKGLWYCAAHKDAGEQGFGLPGDSVSGGHVRPVKKEGELI